jgi:hypothetical protein
LEGYVLVRVKGSWHPYCSDLWSMEMGEKICRFLGYNMLISLNNFEVDDLEQERNKVSKNPYIYDSTEEETPQLWFLKNSARFDTGPIEDVITKINTNNGEISYNCNMAYVKCSRT